MCRDNEEIKSSTLNKKSVHYHKKTRTRTEGIIARVSREFPSYFSLLPKKKEKEKRKKERRTSFKALLQTLQSIWRRQKGREIETEKKRGRKRRMERAKRKREREKEAVMRTDYPSLDTDTSLFFCHPSPSQHFPLRKFQRSPPKRLGSREDSFR